MLAICISFSLSAQLSQNELLDHSQRQTLLSTFDISNDQIIYVVENHDPGTFSTQVKLIGDDHEVIDLLDEEIKFRSESKIIFDSQGNLRVYIFDLDNIVFDNFSSDIVEVIVAADGSHSSRILESPQGISFEQITSVALDASDKVYAFNNLPKLEMFENGVFQDELLLDSGATGKLHSNNVGEVFFLNNTDDNIYRLDELILTPVNSLVGMVEEIKVVANENWVLHDEGAVSIYNEDFSELVMELNVSVDINTLDQISEFNSHVRVLETTSDGFKLYEFVQGELELQLEQTEDFTSSSKILFMDEDTYLTAGQYQLEDISDHAFFRKFEMGAPFNPTRTDVALNNFNIEYLFDTLITDAPWDNFFYSINYSFQNNSNVVTDKVGLYAREVYDNSPLDFLYKNQYDNPIEPNEVIELNDTKIVGIQHPEFVRVALPGNNFKFNSNNTVSEARILTSTIDLESHNDFTLGPNPFYSDISFTTDSDIEKIEIYNTQGQLVYVNKEKYVSNINLESLAQGNYFFHAVSKDFTYVQLIVKAER